jgi:L-threonylcarbamoyladenylate synthase
VLPTDTVYGLAATADTPAGRDALYRLKGRPERQPSALLAASLAALFDRLPELQRSVGEAVAALLPGPYTLVVPNPAGRYAWLCGDDPMAIGVRVPELTEAAAAVVGAVGAVVATSANLPGAPAARDVQEVPAELRAGSAVVLDGGTLPGVASTVLDLTGAEPRVLRQGAGNPGAALAVLKKS